MKTEPKYLVCNLGNYFFLHGDRVMEVTPENGDVSNYKLSTFETVQVDTEFTIITKRRFTEVLLAAQQMQIQSVIK